MMKYKCPECEMVYTQTAGDGFCCCEGRHALVVIEDIPYHQPPISSIQEALRAALKPRITHGVWCKNKTIEYKRSICEDYMSCDTCEDIYNSGAGFGKLAPE